MVSVTADDGVFAAVTAAQVMVNFADCWSPMTEEISTVMGRGAGGPFAMGEGASKWYNAASKIQQAQQSLVELTSALPRDYWNGEDRDAFDAEINNLAAELGDGHNYAMAVAITLTSLTVPIGAWPVACDTIGVILAANATAFYAAAASIVGDLGPSEALFAEGEAATASCLAVINAGMAVLIAAMAAGTEAIVISDIADIDAQRNHGDTGVAGEFGKAVVDSSGEVALTLALGREGKGHHGRHEAPEDPIDKLLKDKGKEKGKEKGGETINSSLSWLINHGIGAVDPSWNDPDAPKPSDEQWGAGE